MKKDRDEIWRLKIKLFPGPYEYKLFADNTCIANLPGAEGVPTPFGAQNFIVLVR